MDIEIFDVEHGGYSYCQRCKAENRIKETQLDLFDTRALNSS